MKKYSFILILILVLLCQYSVIADTKLSDENSKKETVKTDEIIQFQDYIMFSQETIKSIKSRNEDVVKASIMTTIKNRRDTVILEAKSCGNTKIDVQIGKEKYEICVRVKKSKTIIHTKCKLFNFVSLDKPDGVALLKENKK
ncbi:MAG: hypothetical protein ACI37S_06270 [Candidatus Gastranaerophilaceae bacterium]